MTMMMRLLLLPLCFMHLKEVVGTITFTTDGSLVQTGAEVAMSCKDTDKMDIDIYFGGQAIVSCDLFANLCPVSDPALYSASIDITPAGYNLLTFTIKSFAVSNCGEYTCQKNADTSVNDATTVEHKLSHGENCSTCGQCFPSTLMECSSTCKCNAGYTYDGSACASSPSPDCDCKVLKIVWSVLFIVFSIGSGAWILYVLFAVPKARKWLKEKLCAPTHLCMIGWIFVSLVYSIIAVILYNILVCKDESSEADCWPVYVIIGIVVKGGDVAVSLLALLAFLNDPFPKDIYNIGGV